MNLNALQVAALGQQLEKWKNKAAEVDKIKLRYQTATAQANLKYVEIISQLQEKNTKLEETIAQLTLMMGSQGNLEKLMRDRLNESPQNNQEISEVKEDDNELMLGSIELPPHQQLIRSSSMHIGQVNKLDHRDRQLIDLRRVNKELTHKLDNFQKTVNDKEGLMNRIRQQEEDLQNVQTAKKILHDRYQASEKKAANLEIELIKKNEQVQQLRNDLEKGSLKAKNITMVSRKPNEEVAKIEEKFTKILEEKDAAHLKEHNMMLEELRKAQDALTKLNEQRGREANTMKPQPKTKEPVTGPAKLHSPELEKAVRIDDKIKEVFENRRKKIEEGARQKGYEDLRDKLIEVVKRIYEEYKSLE